MSWVAWLNASSFVNSSRDYQQAEQTEWCGLWKLTSERPTTVDRTRIVLPQQACWVISGFNFKTISDAHGRISEENPFVVVRCTCQKSFNCWWIKMSAISASEKVDGFTRKSMRKAQKQKKSQGSSQFRTQSALAELSPLPQLKGKTINGLINV